MQGIGTLRVINYEFLGIGVGTLTVLGAQQGHATLSGEGMLYAHATSNYGFAMLPRIGAFGGDLPADFGMGSGLLPALIGVAEGDTYVPPQAQIGFGMLPFLISSGMVSSIGNGAGDALLPAIVGRGGETYYGVGYGILPPLFAHGEDDFTPGEVEIHHTILCYNGMRGHQAFSQAFNTTGILADDIDAIREQFEAIMEEISSTGDLAALADFVASFTDGAYLIEVLSALTTNRPSLDDTARTWVVNLGTNASSQYDDFGFNTFFERGGQYYGVAEDGIYLLSGTTDNGVPIEGLVDYGISSFGTAQRKRLMNVYAAVISPDKMLLKVQADGDTYVYEARSNERGHLKHHRFDIGKGLAGTHWRLQLLNQDGCDFDLESIEFEPVILSRKI